METAAQWSDGSDLSNHSGRFSLTNINFVRQECDKLSRSAKEKLFSRHPQVFHFFHKSFFWRFPSGITGFTVPGSTRSLKTLTLLERSNSWEK